MPTPATTAELIALIRRSGVVDDARLDGFLASARADDLSPEELLDRFLADGLLTHYQAIQLAQGRWKGFTLGQYRLLDRIGSGGMSHVYLAEHAQTRERAAVKVLAERLIDDAVAKERFAREARAAAALTHPNIVRLLAVGLEDESPYLVMEYIDGVSLQAAVAKCGTFDAGNAAYCGRQVALGLQRAYEVGLVHRDVKPANILVNRQGLVKLLDLGVVRVPAWEDDGLTRRMGENLVLGTAEYMAPEQAVDCSAVDTRADVYSLGATLYFLLAGHPPFPHGSPVEKMSRKLNSDPPPLDRLRPDLPPGLAGAVHRMLARDREDRYPTPLDAAIALTPFARPEADFPARLLSDRPTLADEGAPTAVNPHAPAAEPEPLQTGSPPTVVLTLSPGTLPEINLGPPDPPPDPDGTKPMAPLPPDTPPAAPPDAPPKARWWWPW